MLLNVEHLYKYFNGQALLKDINFTVEDREAVGLIGINGCGKSTLLNIITGSEGYDKTPRRTRLYEYRRQGFHWLFKAEQRT